MDNLTLSGSTVKSAEEWTTDVFKSAECGLIDNDVMTTAHRGGNG